MTAIQAARAAARIRHDLGLDVEKVHGKYGELTVLVDGEVVLEAGSLAALGILPSLGTILSAVRERIALRAEAGTPPRAAPE